MEWVETTSKSVEEAKELALDKLGVDTADAEFEVLEEPRQGLFGRTRGQARVRARIAPQNTQTNDDRGRRRRKPRGGKSDGGSNKPRGSNQGSGGGSGVSDQSEESTSDSSGSKPRQSGGGGRSRSQGSSDGRNSRGRSSGRGQENGGSKGQRQRSNRSQRSNSPKKEDASMEEVSACVETFLSGLTEAFGIDTEVEIDTSNDEIMAHIEGKHGLLLGPKARTLDAIQELTRVTAQRTVPSSIRIKVDVGGYRVARKASLETFARDAAEKAIEDSVDVVLEPMSSADRKVIHDELNDYAGVSTRSAGTDPRRRVVVVPDEADVVASEDDSSDASEDDE